MSTAMTGESAAMAQLWDAVVDVVSSIDADAWQRPVQWCPDWNVADLVVHLGALQGAFNGAPQPEPPPGWEPPQTDNLFDAAMAPAIAARRDWTPAQRVDELRRSAADHVAALSRVDDWDAPAQGPVGPTTQAGLFLVRAFDVWVHLQDLREALGMTVDLHDGSDAARAAYDHVLGIVGWMFAKRVGAGEGDTVTLELTAPLDTRQTLRVVDRRARFEDPDPAVDSRVTASPAALTLLTSGRGTPQRWCDAGALDWTGSLGEAFVQRARMF